MIRSTTKSTAAISTKQLVGTITLQSRKIQSLSSNLPKGDNKIASNPLKQRSVVGFKMQQTIPSGTNGL